MTTSPFELRRIAASAYGPSLLFGLCAGAILPVIALSARELGASVPMAALIVTLLGIGSLISNIPASLITMHRGERWAMVAAAGWCAVALAVCAWTSHLVTFAIGIFMVGTSQAVLNVARQSYLTEAVPAEYRARAMSTLGGILRIGMFLGPIVAAAAFTCAASPLHWRWRASSPRVCQTWKRLRPNRQRRQPRGLRPRRRP
jgi:MFS family permease